MTENRFETELIQYITTGTISNPDTFLCRMMGDIFLS